MSAFKFLISGFDTIECAYYLIASDDYKLDFIELAAQKESMVRAKVTKPKPIQIGSEVCIIRKKATHYHLKKAGYNHSKRPHIIIQSRH